MSVGYPQSPHAWAHWASKQAIERNLTALQAHVLLTFALHANPDGDGIFMGVGTLSKRVVRGRTQTSTAITDLVELGLIERYSRGLGTSWGTRLIAVRPAEHTADDTLRPAEHPPHGQPNIRRTASRTQTLQGTLQTDHAEEGRARARAKSRLRQANRLFNAAFEHEHALGDVEAFSSGYNDDDRVRFEESLDELDRTIAGDERHRRLAVAAVVNLIKSNGPSLTGTTLELYEHEIARRSRETNGQAAFAV